jgi:hypothetical protein
VKMKILIAVLLLCAVSGLVGGITGVKRYRYSSNSGAEVTRYDPPGRAGVLLFGSTALAAAVGCWKRRKFGWYATVALLCAGVALTLWGVVVILAASWSNIPTAIVWLAQTVAMGFLIRWWFRQRPLFDPSKKPNQVPEPTSGLAPGRGSS